MPPALHLDAVSKSFGTLKAVAGVSLTVQPGEVVGLVGPDGAGKTTTLRLLAGLLSPESGTVQVAGLDVAKKPDEVRDRIGYMSQRFGMYPDLTVEENMDFYADLFAVPPQELEPLKQKLLAMTRMAPFRARPAGKLSGGMKQKLALMCTLLHKPQILLLDEPTNGVDPVSRRDFWLILKDLTAQGMTLLVTTAYLDEAERCQKVALMHRGRIVQSGAPAELKKLAPGPCFQVTAPDVRALRAHLQSHPQILSVKPAGDQLHVFLRHTEPPPDAPGQWLPIEPSLEDIFVTLIEAEPEPALA
jgi:ABC-2 type transport system ATP-binding protein